MNRDQTPTVYDTPRFQKAWATYIAAFKLASRLDWCDTPERYRTRSIRTEREKRAAWAAFILVRKAAAVCEDLKARFRVGGYFA